MTISIAMARFPVELPDLHLIEAIYDYDPVLGVFTSKRTGKVDVGSFDRTMDCRKLKLGKKYHPSHRVAWYMYYREDPAPFFVRHVDGNRLNNSISNLTLQASAASVRSGEIKTEHL